MEKKYWYWIGCGLIGLGIGASGLPPFSGITLSMGIIIFAGLSIR